MCEMGNFLYGQIVVGSGLIQLFRVSLVSVDDLHDGRVAAVHAGAVLQRVHGIAVSVDAKALHGRPIVCGEGHFFPRRFRLTLLLFFRLRLRPGGSGLFLFSLCDGSGNAFLPQVVLNAFFPYFFDLVRHDVE